MKIDVHRMGFISALYLIAATFSAAQNASGVAPPGPEMQQCAMLADLNLETAPGGPAIISSARLVDVPASGLEQWFVIPSGYGTTSSQIVTCPSPKSRMRLK